MPLICRLSSFLSTLHSIQLVRLICRPSYHLSPLRITQLVPHPSIWTQNLLEQCHFYHPYPPITHNGQQRRRSAVNRACMRYTASDALGIAPHGPCSPLSINRPWVYQPWIYSDYVHWPDSRIRSWSTHQTRVHHSPRSHLASSPEQAPIGPPSHLYE